MMSEKAYPFIVLNVQNFNPGVYSKRRDDLIDHVAIRIRPHVILQSQNFAISLEAV